MTPFPITLISIITPPISHGSAETASTPQQQLLELLQQSLPGGNNNNNQINMQELLLKAQQGGQNLNPNNGLAQTASTPQQQLLELLQQSPSRGDNQMNLQELLLKAQQGSQNINPHAQTQGLTQGSTLQQLQGLIQQNKQAQAVVNPHNPINPLNPTSPQTPGLNALVQNQLIQQLSQRESSTCLLLTVAVLFFKLFTGFYLFQIAF